MRKIREILSLRFELHLSLEQIAASCGIGRTTVFDQLKRFHQSSLSWPLSGEMDDAEPEKRLYPSSASCGYHNRGNLTPLSRP